MKIACAIMIALAAPVGAAVQGIVHNGTTGRPASGVEVALMKLDQGMIPAGAATTDANGRFRFETSIEGTHGLLRAQFDGVTYTEIVTPGSRTGDIQLAVFHASKAALSPENRVMIVEPSGGEIVISESYLFRNQSQPPVTYMGGGHGTLRFYVPAAAKGGAQVTVTGTGGVPLRLSAEKTAEADVFKVDYPIKPGENRIDVGYVVSYRSGQELVGRTLYPEVATRIAVPDGVTLAGEALQPLGQEPQTKASIFSIARAEFRLTVTGDGRLPRDRASGEEEGGRIAAAPAAVYRQQWVIFGFAAVILLLGFYALYAASGKPAPAAPNAPKSPGKKRKS